MALPPLPSMMPTTTSASRPPPSPDTDDPRSFTTTVAPWAASSRACARPIPWPAPVTRATLPSSRELMKTLSMLCAPALEAAEFRRPALHERADTLARVFRGGLNLLCHRLREEGRGAVPIRRGVEQPLGQADRGGGRGGEA